MSVQTSIATGFARLVSAINVLAGKSLPSGGANGQVLAKTSATDYAVSWQTPSGGAVQVYVQDAQPAMVENQPWIWWKTIGGAISDYYVFDGVI